jgi:probable rRNA maturation factor
LDNPEAELSLLILDDRQIAELNREYLQREGPTNVIAFPMREWDDLQPPTPLLGDVVISAQRAEREANEAGMNVSLRFAQLLVHGILHLFGYDHESGETQALEMDARSHELLNRIGPQIDDLLL